MAIIKKSSSENPLPFYLARTILTNSVVFQVAYGNLRFPSSADVVFGKETSIELVIINDDGTLQSICEQPVFGTVKDLSILPWNEVFRARTRKLIGKDILVVISNTGKLSFLSFCTEKHRFFPIEHVELSPPGNLRDDVGRTLAVDSNGCFVAAGLFEDKLALLSVSESSCTAMVDKKIIWPPENGSFNGDDTYALGAIWSMCFIAQAIDKRNEPLIAIVVNREWSSQNDLLLLKWKISDEAVYVLSRFYEAGPLAHHIVEVPNSFGYAFLFRDGDALLMELHNKRRLTCVYKSSLDITSDMSNSIVKGQNLTQPTDISDIIDEDGIDFVVASKLPKLSNRYKSVLKSNYVCSWSWEPGTMKHPRLIFSAKSGDLYLVELLFDSGNKLKFNISKSLYKHLPFKALLWVEGGLLAAFVMMGDGMVLKLEAGCLSYRGPIQNTAPVFDMKVVDYPDDKRDKMFACCGVASNGSVRIIRSGSSVNKLLTTPDIYQGITGTWAVKLRTTDAFHSFLVLSFIEETRVLSVGVSFSDVTDSSGFLANVCTLACGLVADNLLVQIHQSAVRICMPVEPDRSEAIPSNAPHCPSWSPGSTNISLGAVVKDLIVVATFSPCHLFILGIKFSPTYEIFLMQQVRRKDELSCISIPRSCFKNESSTRLNLASDGGSNDYQIIIGTRKPSVEVLLFSPDTGLQVLAVGSIFKDTIGGIGIYGYTPQDVQLVLVDHPYVLVGLRNGMLLKFEWRISSAVSPSSSLVNSAAIGGNISLPCGESFDGTRHNIPDDLRVVFACRVGRNPVSLIPLSDCSTSDIIALSDKPWLLHTARQPLLDTPISSEPATHATPVSLGECPKGFLFVAENRLHLVEMDPSKSLEIQKICIEGTPQRILYHSDSKLLLLLRNDLSNGSCSSDICYVDPISGSVFPSYRFEPGEAGRCMDLMTVGRDKVLVVGTQQYFIMPGGEAVSTHGRLVLLYLKHRKRKHEEGIAWHLRLVCSRVMPGIVRAVCPYLDRYFLASAANAFYVYSYKNLKLKERAVERTSYMVMTLSTYNNTIAVGNGHGGVAFYSYNDDTEKLTKMHCDPFGREVADCILMDAETAVVSDRRGGIAVMSSAEFPEGDQEEGIDVLSPSDLPSDDEHYLSHTVYNTGEVGKCIWKGTMLIDDSNSQRKCIMVGTVLGRIMTFIPLWKREYELLKLVQDRLAVHPLAAPILGTNHDKYRSVYFGAVERILDGDMLSQFLELTIEQQHDVLELPQPSTLTNNPLLAYVKRILIRILSVLK